MQEKVARLEQVEQDLAALKQKLERTRQSLEGVAAVRHGDVGTPTTATTAEQSLAILQVDDRLAALERMVAESTQDGLAALERPALWTTAQDAAAPRQREQKPEQSRDPMRPERLPCSRTTTELPPPPYKDATFSPEPAQEPLLRGGIVIKKGDSGDDERYMPKWKKSRLPERLGMAVWYRRGAYGQRRRIDCAVGSARPGPETDIYFTCLGSKKKWSTRFDMRMNRFTIRLSIFGWMKTWSWEDGSQQLNSLSPKLGLVELHDKYCDCQCFKDLVVRT